MKKFKDWTEYAPEELEVQYDNRAAVPGHEIIFKSWEERSRISRQKLKGDFDLSYGKHPRQKLDIFYPASPGAAPLQIFIHGGYWQAMDKSFFSFIAEGLVEKGAAVAIVNYRLCPAVTVADIVGDIREATLWLCEKGGGLGLDTSRIQVSGHSAGGHLLAMLWATDWEKSGSAERVRGEEPLFINGISISGLFELEPLVKTPLNNALGMSKKEAKALSPALNTATLKAPLLLVVGGKESDEYHRQGVKLKASWENGGPRTEIIELEGHNHFTVLDELAKPTGKLCSLAASYLKIG